MIVKHLIFCCLEESGHITVKTTGRQLNALSAAATNGMSWCISKKQSSEVRGANHQHKIRQRKVQYHGVLHRCWARRKVTTSHRHESRLWIIVYFQRFHYRRTLLHPNDTEKCLTERCNSLLEKTLAAANVSCITRRSRRVQLNQLLSESELRREENWQLTSSSDEERATDVFVSGPDTVLHSAAAEARAANNVVSVQPSVWSLSTRPVSTVLVFEKPGAGCPTTFWIRSLTDNFLEMSDRDMADMSLLRLSAVLPLDFSRSKLTSRVLPVTNKKFNPYFTYVNKLSSNREYKPHAFTQNQFPANNGPSVGYFDKIYRFTRQSFCCQGLSYTLIIIYSVLRITVDNCSRRRRISQWMHTDPQQAQKFNARKVTCKSATSQLTTQKTVSSQSNRGWQPVS